MTSLSPEAIEILKSINGKMCLKFKTEEKAEDFVDKIDNDEFFEEELNRFQLRDCFEAPEYMWPDDDEDAYWYVNVTEYGHGATKLLKTLGLI